MRRLKLFIATSLDGYIADELGHISFLESVTGTEPDSTYEDFIQEIDTVLLGSTTYLQIIQELAPDNYPYATMNSLVFSSQANLPLKDNVTILNQPVTAVVAELKKKPGKDIWLVGGASLVGPLVAANLIDDYYISLTPYLLGQGIPLFSPTRAAQPLQLVKAHEVNGMIHTHYVAKT